MPSRPSSIPGWTISSSKTTWSSAAPDARQLERIFPLIENTSCLRGRLGPAFNHEDAKNRQVFGCGWTDRVTRPKIFHFLETNLKMATGVHEHVHVNVNEIRARGRPFDLVAARLRREIRGQGFF